MPGNTLLAANGPEHDEVPLFLILQPLNKYFQLWLSQHTSVPWLQV